MPLEWKESRNQLMGPLLLKSQFDKLGSETFKKQIWGIKRHFLDGKTLSLKHRNPSVILHADTFPMVQESPQS